jgi:predicted transcriptional regulator
MQRLSSTYCSVGIFADCQQRDALSYLLTSPIIARHLPRDHMLNHAAHAHTHWVDCWRHDPTNCTHDVASHIYTIAMLDLRYAYVYNVDMEKKTASFVRVHPDTRQKLKVLAAQRTLTMQQLIECLIQAELDREQQQASLQQDNVFQQGGR